MGIFSKDNDNLKEKEKEEAEKLFEDGSRLFKLKQYEAAVKEFKNALKFNNPKLEFDILYHIGLSFYNLEDYKEAINHFEKIIKIKEDNEKKSSAYYYKGICFLKKNKNEKTALKALDCFSNGLEINPKDIDCLYMKGCMETELQGMKEATESFDKVLELDPKFENYYECELFAKIKEEKGLLKEEKQETEKKAKEFKTKVGLKVNKMSELIIANFLFDNDIKFQYKPLATWSKENFEPLFFLPKFDVYLEHFEEEDENMKKKKEIYHNYNKSLIYTTPKDEEDFLNVLKVKLKDYVSDIMKKKSLMSK